MDENWRWFHLTTHTYGAWLYGDDRGFRTRHHREHIEGDYKHRPPAGKYALQRERSIRLMKQEAVSLPSEFRKIVGEALRDKMLELGAQLIAISMSSTHAHLLAKMPGGPIPRKWLGRAKKHATFVAHEAGWKGLLWAARSKPNPIKNRQHQLNTFDYILRHAEEGAWVWSFRDGIKPKAQG
jgi:hypothetical protein